METIKRRIVEELVDGPPAARRRAIPRAQTDAPVMPVRRSERAHSSSARGWFTDAERQAMYDHATGNAKWKAGQAEHGEAMDRLLRAGAPQHKVFALGATRRLTLRMAELAQVGRHYQAADDGGPSTGPGVQPR